MYARNNCIVFTVLSILIISSKLAALSRSTGVIRGKVVEESTGLPIHSAIIRTPRSGHIVSTNQQGVFTIVDLTAKKYDLHIQLRGYESKVIEDVPVTINGENEVYIILSQESQISKEMPQLVGTVFDALTREAVKGALIELSTEQKDYHEPVMTNYDGQFTLRGLPNGVYTITIRHYNFELKLLKNIRIDTTTINHIAIKLTPRAFSSHLIE